MTNSILRRSSKFHLQHQLVYLSFLSWKKRKNKMDNETQTTHRKFVSRLCFQILFTKVAERV